MPLDTPDFPPDSPAQRQADLRRLRRACGFSLGLVALLAAMFGLQHALDLRALAVAPGTMTGLLGILGAPLLHASFEHLTTNVIALLLLGTLAATAYPRATLRALPWLWLGSGLGAWLLGEPGSRHLGASGLTHGLMFLLLALGLLRRDRPSIAAGMLAFLFHGGMLLTILPREAGVSWQSHIGGAIAGILIAWPLRHSDPPTPRKRYSWELEEAAETAETAEAADPQAELPPPPLAGQLPPFRRPSSES